RASPYGRIPGTVVRMTVLVEDRTIWMAIEEEVSAAEATWGPFHSSHEGLGVLAEEYQEFLEAVRADDLDAIQYEAIQVAAVAYRIATARRSQTALPPRARPPP